MTGLGLEPETSPNLFNQLKLKDRIKAHHIPISARLANTYGIVENLQPEMWFSPGSATTSATKLQRPIGTWATNVQGSLHLLEALKAVAADLCCGDGDHRQGICNKEWDYGYRENDRLGGHDPYSASKAAAEIAIKQLAFKFLRA